MDVLCWCWYSKCSLTAYICKSRSKIATRTSINILLLLILPIYFPTTNASGTSDCRIQVFRVVMVESGKKALSCFVTVFNLFMIFPSVVAEFRQVLF